MQHIALLTLGSRGDVQPFIALGLGLKQSGYDVTLVTYSKFRTLVSSYGLNFFSIENSYEKIAVELAQSPGNPFSAARRLRQSIEPILDKVLVECWAGCQSADVIVSSGTAFWGFDIAEKLNLPHILASFLPLNPTEEFPHCLVPPVNINGSLNRLSALFVSRTFWASVASSINRWRMQSLELAPWKEVPFESSRWKKQLELLAYSSLLVPQPQDWDSNVHTTGYWFLEAPKAFNPEPKLLNFLANEQKPVYVGFGSMAINRPQELARIFYEALKETGRKGIFSGDLVKGIVSDDNVLCVGSIPHDWLFPMIDLAIHHSGAGTTGAVIKAGCPSISVPFFNDQPFWANRLFERGVSPAPLKKKTLTANDIKTAINIATTSNMKAKAEELGIRIRKENGVSRAVSLIQNYLDQ